MSESFEAENASSTGRSCVGPLFAGCGTALVAALLCAGVMTYLGDRFWDFISDQNRRIQADERLAEDWDAPAETAGIEEFSPQMIGQYTLASVDNDADFPALKIEARGFHALYEKDESEIDVTVYRMNETEKEKLFDKVARLIQDDDRFPNHRLTRRPRVIDFRVERPPLAGRLWYAKGWLVFVRGHSEKDIADFTQAYLKAVEQDESDQPAEASDPKPAPKPPIP